MSALETKQAGTEHAVKALQVGVTVENTSTRGLWHCLLLLAVPRGPWWHAPMHPVSSAVCKVVSSSGTASSRLGLQHLSVDKPDHQRNLNRLAVRRHRTLPTPRRCPGCAATWTKSAPPPRQQTPRWPRCAPRAPTTAAGWASSARRPRSRAQPSLRSRERCAPCWQAVFSATLSDHTLEQLLTASLALHKKCKRCYVIACHDQWHCPTLAIPNICHLRLRATRRSCSMVTSLPLPTLRPQSASARRRPSRPRSQRTPAGCKSWRAPPTTARRAPGSWARGWRRWRPPAPAPRPRCQTCATRCDCNPATAVLILSLLLALLAPITAMCITLMLLLWLPACGLCRVALRCVDCTLLN